LEVVERIGSANETKGILRSGDTGKVIDLEMAYSNASRRHLRFGRFPLGGQIRARN
jgi:hypothetical protein